MPSSSKLAGEVHGVIFKLGFSAETVVQTALVDAYFKSGSLPSAVLAFEEMEIKDTVAWNCMVSGFVRRGLPAGAISVFRQMQQNGSEISGFTLSSVLKACCELGAIEQGKQIHSLTIVAGNESVVLGSSLVDFYSDCGLISDAVEVFNTLRCEKDETIYNALLSGCVRNGKYAAAFSMMKELPPNAIAVTTILAACAESCDLNSGKQVHAVVLRRSLETNVLLCNALLTMYSKCGKVDAARRVFDLISNKNVVTWTGMINAYGSHGRGREALELFQTMVEVEHGRNTPPNEVTFLTVIAACSHCGLVEDARKCFLLMSDKYGLKPGPEHYACFIDMLGRAGKVEEMWVVFKRMEINGTLPTGEVWAALLNGCRLNMDMVRGAYAADALFELEPDKPGNYVSLSNFYAAVGNWEKVEELRKLMRAKGMNKELGSSLVAVQFGS